MIGRFFVNEAPLYSLHGAADCGSLGCKKCQDGRRKKKKYPQGTIPDTSNAPPAMWNLQGPVRMGQSFTPIVPPAPQVPKSLATQLLLGAVGGAGAGFLVAFLAPKVEKKFPKTQGAKVAGTIGGSIAGMVAVLVNGLTT